MRWNTLTVKRGLAAHTLVTLTLIWHTMWDNMEIQELYWGTAAAVCEDIEHHLYSVHTTNLTQLCQHWDQCKIPPPACWVWIISLALHFKACMLLSAAGETQWPKPQETCELTERVVGVCSTISVPSRHLAETGQHHFLRMTPWQNQTL